MDSQWEEAGEVFKTDHQKSGTSPGLVTDSRHDPCRLEGRGFSVLSWHLCRMVSLLISVNDLYFLVLGTFLLDRCRALWPCYSWLFKTHSFDNEVELLVASARPSSLISEDQVKSTVVFLWDDCFKLYLVQNVSLFYFEVILDL